MAPKLGIHVWRQNRYYPAGNSEGETSISFAEWTNIVNYFEREAPETLEPADRPTPLSDSGKSIFSVEKPAVVDSVAPIAATTMAKIAPSSGYIYTSDANTNALVRWDQELDSTTVLSMTSPAVDLNFADDFAESERAVLTTIGTMKADDIYRGIVQHVKLGDQTVDTLGVIDRKLNRPLRSLSADFDKDGDKDWVICTFGHESGALYLYKQEPDHSYERETIRGVPGAEDAVIEDFNRDGWPDLMVLFAYDNEGIWLFLNDKNGGFESKNVLRFPPVYGSTSFELADINGDDANDIILTNGDNADFSPILKPYHGLRIYLNEGEYNYKEAYFYPINGTTQSVVEDFDNDGDKDIAAISFFADFENNPAESFIYFENRGGMKFKPTAVPIHKLGRWITMDAGDVDDDGDLDLVLGNFSRKFMSSFNVDPSWDTHMPFVLLRNNTN